MADFWAGYGQQQKPTQQKSSGGLGGFLYDSFVKPTVDSTVRGGQALTTIANNIGNKGLGHTFDNVNGKQLLADTVTAGTSFAPIGAAKGIMGAAKLGAGIGAANGAANTFAQGGNAGEVAGGALSGGVAGGVTGGALGAAGRLLGGLGKGRTPAAVPGEVEGGKLSTFLQDKGLQTQARSGGYGVGEKAGPGRSLGYMDSARVNETLKGVGIKPGSPTARLKQVELNLGGLGKNIDTLIGQSNQPLEVGNHAQVVGDYLNSVANQPGVDPAVAKNARQLAANFMGQVKDTKSLIDFRRNLDKQVINFGQNPDSAMAAKQLAARTFRDVLKDHTNQLVPGIQDLNNQYHDLTNASEFLKGGSKVLSDQSQSQGGGVLGRMLTSESAQAAKSRTGAAMQSAGQALGTPTASPRSGRLSGLLTRTAEAGAGVDASAPNQAPAQDQAGAPGQFSDAFATNTGMGGDSAGMGTQSGAESAYGQEAMLADVQRDPKHAADYMALYKALQPTAQTSAIGKPTASQFGAAQSGLSSIQMMEQILGKDPGVVGRTAIPGQNAPLISGLVRNAAGTGDYQAAAQNAIDAIARARTGAAMNKSEEAFYQRMLPTAGDSAQTVQYKLGQLKAALEPFMGKQSGGATGDGSYADNQQILQALGL